jgi:uncharacterized protein
MAPKGKKKGRARKKKIKLRTLALGLLVGGGLLLTSLSLFLLSGGFSKFASHEKTSRGISSKKQNVKGNQTARKPQRKEGKAARGGEDSEGLPKVAILIDDVGFDVELARSFLELKPRLSLSILPTAPHAQAVAREAAREGAEVLLHLPMEAKESEDGDPGAGALLVTMGEEEFVETLNSHLNRIPGIQGVNNHMGSLLTEREDKIALLFRELKKRHLFYVDSRTTPQTVASQIAMEMKVPMASRNVFLDHELSQEAMSAQWDRFLAMARQHGHALVIAHPHRETLVFLREHLQDLRSEARLVRVADIVN